MSAFQGMEDLLQDFLTEASELLSDVDNKLVELEKRPDDRKLLNDIFRGFHTIKGGAGFLNVAELVALCHLTENLFDKLRNGQLSLRQETMDVILEATGNVRAMFDQLSQKSMPTAADPALLKALQQVLDPSAPANVVTEIAAVSRPISQNSDLNWEDLYAAVAGPAPQSAPVPGATPVASPASVTVAVAGFALDHVNAIPLISFPYWSLPTALNCWAPPAKTDGCDGVTKTVARVGGGASTVRAAGALVTPEADAVMCITPADIPVATPP